MRRTMVALALVAALGLATMSSPASGAADNVPRTVEDLGAISKAMSNAGSVRFAGTISVTRSDSQARYEYAVAGVSDLERNRSAWAVTAADAPDDRLRFVSAGSTVFMSVDGIVGPRPDAIGTKEWVRFSRSANGAPGDISGPRGRLDFAALPGIQFENVGADRLNGVKTTHVHLQWPVELPAVPLSNGFTLPARSEVQRVDLWIDAQGRLRRETSVQVSRQGRTTASIRSLMDYSRYESHVTVRVPDPDSVADAADLDPNSLPVV